MPKHIYDENGRYRGEILSDSEHNKRKNGGGTPSKCFICKENYGFIEVEGSWLKEICSECRDKLSKKRIKSYLKTQRKLNVRMWSIIILFILIFRNWNSSYPFENAMYFALAFMVIVGLIFCWPIIKLKEKMKNEDKIK